MRGAILYIHCSEVDVIVSKLVLEIVARRLSRVRRLLYGCGHLAYLWRRCDDQDRLLLALRLLALYQLLYVAFEDLVHAAGLALKQMLLLQVLFHRQLVLFAYFGVRHGILRYFLY